MTNNLKWRLIQHKKGNKNSFSERYNLDKLVCFETTKYVLKAIKREKQIKKWNREWKLT